jgi:hypothetical protein
MPRVCWMLAAVVVCVAAACAVKAGAPDADVADVRKTLRATLVLPDGAEAVAAAQRIVDAHPKEAEAVLMEITPHLRDPDRSRAIVLLARRPETEALYRFFNDPWPDSDPPKGPVDREALRAVLEMHSTGISMAALDKLVGDRKDDAENAVIRIFADLNPKGQGQSNALYWISHRPDTPAIRAFFLKWAAAGSDGVRIEAAWQIVQRADKWPAEDKALAVKRVLSRIEMDDDRGGGAAQWLAHQGAAEAVPILQRRLERLSKAEGPAKRFELSVARSSSHQGQIVAALATLGDEKAKEDIRASLAQAKDLQRLAWGIWAAVETGQADWAPLLAEHLDDDRVYLVVAMGDDPGDETTPGRSSCTKLQVDAMAVQALAALCHPEWSFKPWDVGHFAEFDTLLQSDGSSDLISEGYTADHVKEVRDWWARNRDKLKPKPAPKPNP